MSFLVLGASGFIGNHLVAQFKNVGVQVIGTTRSGNSENGYFQIDLGVEFEYKKVISLIENYEVTQIINLAASEVSPVNRTKVNERLDTLFFTNLSKVLNTYRDIGLLQIGTCLVPEREDSYFASKRNLKDLLSKGDSREQIAFLDLPKVVGTGEPRGRFTSDLIDSLNMKRRHTVLHPCHKRNFIAMNDVVSLISRIVETRHLSDCQYPMIDAEIFSNIEIVRMLIGYSSQNGKEITFDHQETNNDCRVCPDDEEKLVIRPEFLDDRKVSFFSMDSRISIGETLREQYIYATTNPSRD